MVAVSIIVRRRDGKIRALDQAVTACVGDGKGIRQYLERLMAIVSVDSIGAEIVIRLGFGNFHVPQWQNSIRLRGNGDGPVDQLLAMIRVDDTGLANGGGLFVGGILAVGLVHASGALGLLALGILVGDLVADPQVALDVIRHLIRHDGGIGDGQRAIDVLILAEVIVEHFDFAVAV